MGIVRNLKIHTRRGILDVMAIFDAETNDKILNVENRSWREKLPSRYNKLNFVSGDLANDTVEYFPIMLVGNVNLRRHKYTRD